MRRATLVKLLAAGWLVIFAASFVLFVQTEPTGSGFTRGLNRTMTWLGWQAAALAAAVTTLTVTIAARRELGRLERWTGYTPAIVSGIAVLGVALLVAGAVALD